MITERELQLNGRFLDVILLHKEGYCCSQIMAILALRDQGRENPDLVRAMGGLCHGIATMRDICGALSGGACLLSFYAGKGTDREVAHRQLPLMLFELTEWFKDRTGGTFEGMKCNEILSRSPDQRVCLSLASETYDKVLSILQSHDINDAGNGNG
jgi:C_GCAxxG_C_C family probable redox protein